MLLEKKGEVGRKTMTLSKRKRGSLEVLSEKWEAVNRSLGKGSRVVGAGKRSLPFDEKEA